MVTMSPLLHLIACAFVKLRPLEVLIVEGVADAEFAITPVVLGKQVLRPVHGCQCVGQVGPCDVAVGSPLHHDVDDIGRAFAVAHAGIVDVLDVPDGLDIQCHQVFLRGSDVVDTYLHAAQVG